VDVAQLAHTTLVVEAPGLGDDVQAIKAGILEIADILVVNKADQPGAEATVRALRGMLSLGRSNAREVPICETVATESKGLPELLAAIETHRTYLRQSGHLSEKNRARATRQIEMILRDVLYQRFVGEEDRSTKIASAVAAVLERTKDPYTAVLELLP
jgi:LAO/AO transport system kinase